MAIRMQQMLCAMLNVSPLDAGRTIIGIHGGGLIADGI
jgi:hypothetical protein